MAYPEKSLIGEFAEKLSKIPALFIMVMSSIIVSGGDFLGRLFEGSNGSNRK